jgi:hypothetical protein
VGSSGVLTLAELDLIASFNLQVIDELSPVLEMASLELATITR